MKVLKKTHVLNKRQVEHTMSERYVLGRTQHPFIVGMHYAFQTERKLYMVTDYYPGMCIEGCEAFDPMARRQLR